MDVLGPYPETETPFDLKPEDLPGMISEVMQTPYLSQTIPIKPSPVHGILLNLRILITLPVSIRDKSVATHFIFDTCAPRTYLARSVLEALDDDMHTLSTEVVRINGTKTLVEISDFGHFAGLNILGMDFMDRAGIVMTLNMKTNTAIFHW